MNLLLAIEAVFPDATAKPLACRCTGCTNQDGWPVFRATLLSLGLLHHLCYLLWCVTCHVEEVGHNFISTGYRFFLITLVCLSNLASMTKTHIYHFQLSLTKSHENVQSSSN